jgi:four helix bundle protein
MTVQHYQQLEVWRLAMELAEECYRATKVFPKEELFGLVSQIRRAAASIPANIAEGQGREHTREFLNHLSIARGSLMELETHLILSQRVRLLAEAELESLLAITDRVSRMLSGLRKSLQKRLDTRRHPIPPPITHHPAPTTRHPPLPTRHPPPATRHPPPATTN